MPYPVLFNPIQISTDIETPARPLYAAENNSQRRYNMKSNWNEMDASQKREAIVLTVLPAIALIFIILDMTGKWTNNIHYLMLAILSVYEGITGWNKNRKMAILELVAALFLAANAFIS